MVKDKSFCFVAFFILFHAISFAQIENSKSITAARAYAKCDAVFPKCFIGNWKGQLQWMVAGRHTQTFTMQLRINPADTAGQYTWQIIYGDDDKDNRPYILKPVDTAKNYWVIDEGNGIVLGSYVFGNCLQGAFSVSENTIVDNYCVEGDSMQVEFFNIKLGDKKQSGKGTDEVPQVNSYRLSGYQKGVLKKMK
jgi:hypothetical protein